MQKFKIPRAHTGYFTEQQLMLASDQEKVLSFIQHSFSLEHFAKQIELKQRTFGAKERNVLKTYWGGLYSNKKQSPAVQSNIERVGESNCFTITTGHQLNVFSGPVFMIYKILHVIRLCEELKKEYPENQFVPVFWMATEDHDYEEISSVELFGRDLTWETSQTGAVGRFNTEGLDALKEEIRLSYERVDTNQIDALLSSYSGNSLTEATFSLIHELFAEYGLLCIDGDDMSLKQQLVPFIQKELVEEFSYSAVNTTNERLIHEGWKIQATPREVNLFYLKENSRERILKIDDGFYIEGTGERSLNELLEEVNLHPERFSPNVILRPVYQEILLPNLCYVGGAGEISYWLQLKGVFDRVSIPYPLIQVRASLLLIDSSTSKKMDKYGVALENMFQDTHRLKEQYLAREASEEVDFSQIDEHLEQLRTTIIAHVTACDSGLSGYAEAEAVRLEKSIQGIKDKITKTVKQRHETAIRAIEQIHERINPKNSMQERTVSMFSLSADGDLKSFIQHVHESIDPFDPDFVVLRS
jgi:bacillithiol biosynthesis cysteine-adding enzyme BshC